MSQDQLRCVFADNTDAARKKKEYANADKLTKTMPRACKRIFFVCVSSWVEV